MDVLEFLKKLHEANTIGIVEYELAIRFSKLFPGEDSQVILLFVLVVQYQLKGNICIYIEDITRNLQPVELTKNLQPDKLCSLLKNSELVATEGELKPLVFEEGRLYLHKYWKYETELASWILDKSQQQVKSIPRNITEIIESYFENGGAVNWQKVAVKLALIKSFVIISGGPGTGKTYTVAKIVDTFFKSGISRIALAATTGKAAQRLTDAINREDVSAVTIHKLLGYKPDGDFLFGKENKLPYDAVIVDEGSMLDIRLWVQLIRALSESCKLIVLGDKDQLASVEAGSILGDICSKADNSFSASVTKELEIPSKSENGCLNDSIILLKRSFRFNEQSGLNQLAQAINQGDSQECLDLFSSSEYPDVQLLSPSNKIITEVLQEKIIQTYQKYVDEDPGRQFEIFNEYRVLCVTRKGRFGVEQINYICEQSVRKLLGAKQTVWYPGRPVLFTKNGRSINVRNGETGIYRAVDGNDFLVVEGDPSRMIPTNRVQNYEPSFCMTVHKSQGSEFENVVLLLPDAINPLLTRELLYTAVTRARKSLLVVGKQSIFEEAVHQKIIRTSGLANKLRV